MKKNEKFSKLYKDINIFSLMMKKNRLDIYSSSAAFFVFLSVIPFVILILAIIPYTPVTDSDLYSFVLRLLPERFEHLAFDIMEELTKESFAVISISAIGALWSAARGIQSLKLGLNSIHGVVETRNFIILRLSAVFYTMVFIVYVFVVFIFSNISSRLFNYILNVLEISADPNNFLSNLYELRLLFLIPVTFIVVLYLFWACPNVKLTIRSQVPGALFVSIVWYAFSHVFNFYVDMFNGFSMYGSLSFIIVELLWLYSCMYIFFIGAQGNYYLSIRRKEAKINS